MNKEKIWKPVVYRGVDYTGLYEISNFGNIVILENNKRKELGKNRTRRRAVTLRKGDSKVFVGIGRLLAEVFIRPLKKNEVGDHIDNDPTNDHIDNIQILTYGENISKDHYTKKRS